MTATPTPMPIRWNWFFNGFRRYCVRYLRKNFHALRIANGSALVPNDGKPILVYVNHPSWWDPIVSVVLSNQWPEYTYYAAIDADMLKKYAVFKRLGFFGVEQNSFRGAAEFLRTSTALLTQPRNMVWLTAQGQFADVRTRPLGLRAGVAHLAARLPDAYVLPMAMEFCYWTERTPEVLIQFAPAFATALTPDRTAKEWLPILETALTQTMDELQDAAKLRDPAQFSEFQKGTAGVGGFYERVQRMQSWATGKRHEAEHIPTTPEKTP